MRLTQLAEDRETTDLPDLKAIMKSCEERDTGRIAKWKDSCRA